MATVLTADEMRLADRHAIDVVGIPSLVLMEVAGRAVADAVVEQALGAPAETRVVAIAGLGNNGADAVVAARHLRDRGFAVQVWLMADPSRGSEELRTQLAIAARLGLSVASVPESLSSVELRDVDVVIDGLFGTGLSRPLEGRPAAIVRALNQSPVRVVSVDIPSGVSADHGQVLGDTVQADVTVTFQCAKVGHLIYPGRGLSGRLLVRDIGIPLESLEAARPRASTVERHVIEDAFPPPAADAPKGTFGHVLIVAGAPERPGAGLLAGRAAFRAGAGLVTLGSDDETIRRLAPALGEIMGAGLGSTVEEGALLRASEGKSAVAIGPSLPPDERTRRSIRALAECDVPLILDAGALAALGSLEDDGARFIADRAAATFVTPHPGEASRLLGQSTAEVQADRPRAARRLAQLVDGYAVLKGASTVVAAPDGRVAVVLEGNPGLGTGGSGDVLTGVTAAVAARGADPWSTARAAVRLHAEAGDQAFREKGFGLVASDVIEALPEVLRSLGR